MRRVFWLLGAAAWGLLGLASGYYYLFYAWLTATPLTPEGLAVVRSRGIFFCWAMPACLLGALACVTFALRSGAGSAGRGGSALERGRRLWGE